MDKVNGEFVDITSDAFGETNYFYGDPGVPNTSTWIAFFKLADINNDSTLDIVFSEYHKAVSTTPVYYINDGFGHFGSNNRVMSLKAIKLKTILRQLKVSPMKRDWVGSLLLYIKTQFGFDN